MARCPLLAFLVVVARVVGFEHVGLAIGSFKHVDAGEIGALGMGGEDCRLGDTVGDEIREVDRIPVAVGAEVTDPLLVLSIVSWFYAAQRFASLPSKQVFCWIS